MPCRTKLNRYGQYLYFFFFFLFVCDLGCDVGKDDARDIIFKVMLKSKLFDRMDLSHEYYAKFGCRNTNLKTRVGYF